MANPKLAVDVDATIWSPYEIAVEEMNRLGNLSLTIADMVHYDSFHEIAGREIANAGFIKACATPQTVAERAFYPYAVETLQDLYHEGIDIHFVTRNVNAERMREPLRRWLDEHLGFPFGLSVGRSGAKLPILSRIGAFGIIDDYPVTLEAVADRGLWAATLIHLWNRDLVESRPDVHGFEDWRDVPSLLDNTLALA